MVGRSSGRPRLHRPRSVGSELPSSLARPDVGAPEAMNAIIKMISGLITPTSGTIRVGGYDVARQRPQAVRQIGAVLEGSRNVYWPLSAWENLMYFGQLKGLRAAEIKPRAQRLLTQLGLWDRRHETVGSFSRGMQQKVAVSAALITDPPIILLDEPTIGLDVEAARTFKDWIK